MARNKKAQSGWQVADEEIKIGRAKTLQSRLGDGLFVWATVLKPLMPGKNADGVSSFSQSVISIGEMILELLQRPMPRVILGVAFLQVAWFLLK